MLKRATAFLLMAAPMWAKAQTNNNIDIGGPKSGFFGGIVKFAQDLVNLVGGPGVLAITVLSLLAGLALWVLSPKNSGAIGFVLRVCAACIVAFNIPLAIAYFRGG